MAPYPSDTSSLLTDLPTGYLGFVAILPGLSSEVDPWFSSLDSLLEFRFRPWRARSIGAAALHNRSRLTSLAGKWTVSSSSLPSSNAFFSYGHPFLVLREKKKKNKKIPAFFSARVDRTETMEDVLVNRSLCFWSVLIVFLHVEAIFFFFLAIVFLDSILSRCSVVWFVSEPLLRMETATIWEIWAPSLGWWGCFCRVSPTCCMILPVVSDFVF